MTIKAKSSTPHDVALRMRVFDASLDLLDHAVAESFGISRTDLRAMELISRVGPASCGELAIALGLTTGSVTALTDRMERAGFLHRTRTAGDRRKVLVALTAMGRERERRAFEPLQREMMQTLSRYSPTELGLIAQFLDTARSVSDRARTRILRLGRGAQRQWP